jgi:lipopolysaccharide transport system ATP-binding protein
MYVRLAFAVAAHLEPEILIVDEVLAVGDAEFQKKCLGKMKDVSVKEGRTVLFVSHNTAAILNLCKQAIFLANGNVSEIGNTNIVISNYMKGKETNAHLTVRTEIFNSIKKAMPYFQLTNFYFKNTPLIGFAIEASQNLIIELIIEGQILQIDNRFNLGFALKNEFGENLIISYSTDQPEKSWIELKEGKFILKTEIDTSFLNEGKYYVYLLGSIHCERMLFTEEDNIRLDFEIIGNRGESPYWINRRNCSFAPYVKWMLQ